MLGFSYDWDREVTTAEPAYYRWTQWIFLQLFNSWYDESANQARPISQLPIPAEVSDCGPRAVREYVDSQRLAYLAEVPVNWCPALGTVLANEEVTNEGRSDRGNHPVYRRPLRQWMLRITKYADRLADDLETLDWPESIKLMQRNWIGRSEGADVVFSVEGRDQPLEVYTTRPDTLFGATYMVLAPEHPLVETITTPDQRQAVSAYCQAAMQRSDLARTTDTKAKTGVPTGAYAINPVWPQGDPRARIPIWVADYVLISYGTGAIMCVPAHDTRDFEFAKQFGLPITPVVMPDDGWLAQQCTAGTGSAPPPDTKEAWSELQKRYVREAGSFPEAFTGDGKAINSQQFDGLATEEFQDQINAWLQERRLGRAAVKYKLRDWLFSRQRYWGEPFPILHGPDGELRALEESELPLELPAIEDYRPTLVPEGSDEMPDPPLGRATDWLTVYRDGKTYRRELNTMPQWAGSCWYYLRFLDPRNSEQFCGPDAERYWMASVKKDGTPHAGGIDLYLGGAEHAVLHLLYARFWHKVLYDLGHVSTPEPFGKLFNQGMIRAFAYQDRRGRYVAYDEIDFREDGAYLKSGGEQLSGAVEKMSKSLKNVINPEEVIHEYGADSLRLYEMFMGPLEAGKPWNPRDVPGVFRFLQRVWRLIAGDLPAGLSTMVSAGEMNQELERALHKTIQKVSQDIERLAFNTAISAMMEFVNQAYRVKTIHQSQAERFVLILSPFAPHLGEELWQRLRGSRWKDSLAYEPWPEFDPHLVIDDQVEIPIQVNGKLAGRVTVDRSAPQDVVEAAALADARVADRIGQATIIKKIYVPGRMLNIVVKK
jgi:leucyl-tRNA synthetase